MKFSVCAVDRDLPVDIPFPLRGKTYTECADLAAHLGFDGIELQIQDPLHYDGKGLRAMLESRHLRVSAVTTGLAYLYEGLSLTHPEAAKRAQTVERLQRQLDLARELGSSILVGFIRGRQLNRSAQEFEEILTHSLGQVLAYAERIKTPLIFEQVNHQDGDIYCSTQRTMEFLEKFNSDYLHFNADTYHMEMDDTDIPAAIRRSLGKLTLFHVSDVGRSLPDDRRFNFRQAAAVLKESGYDNWVSIECKPLPDSLSCCRQGLAYLREVFG